MKKRFIEVRENDEIEGVIQIRDDNYCEVDFEWVQALLEESGRDWSVFSK